MCDKLSREENPWMVDYRRTMALVGEGLSARRVACGDEGLADLPTQHRWGIPCQLLHSTAEHSSDAVESVHKRIAIQHDAAAMLR
jgi:hypothetical protein